MPLEHSYLVGYMYGYPALLVPLLVLIIKICIKNVVGRPIDAPTVYIIVMDIPTDIMFLAISFTAAISASANKVTPVAAELLLIYLALSIFVVLLWRGAGALLSKGGVKEVAFSGFATVLNYAISVAALLHSLAVVAVKT